MSTSEKNSRKWANVKLVNFEYFKLLSKVEILLNLHPNFICRKIYTKKYNSNNSCKIYFFTLLWITFKNIHNDIKALSLYKHFPGKLINCTLYAHQESREILKPVIRPSGTCGLRAELLYCMLLHHTHTHKRKFGFSYGYKQTTPHDYTKLFLFILFYGYLGQ